MSGTSRAWVFTVFQYDKCDPGAWPAAGVTFAVWQTERCPDTGRLHWQGYVEFGTPIRKRQAGLAIGGGAHVEKRHGTQEQASEYATKLDTRVDGPWRIGTPALGQGARTDIYDLSADVRSGLKRRAIVEKHTHLCIKYARGVEYARTNLIQAATWREVRAYFLHGTTGTGKSSFVYETHGHDNVYTLPSQKRTWFDRYDGEPVLLIDEYANGIERETLLRWLDGHPLQVEVKGDHVIAQWTTVYVISNDDWYEHWCPATKRRFQRGGKFLLERSRGRYPELAEYALRGGDRPHPEFR